MTIHFRAACHPVASFCVPVPAVGAVCLVCTIIAAGGDNGGDIAGNNDDDQEQDLIDICLDIRSEPGFPAFDDDHLDRVVAHRDSFVAGMRKIMLDRKSCNQEVITLMQASKWSLVCDDADALSHHCLTCRLSQ